MVIDIEVLARPPALLFVTVVKTIDGRETAQFERLLGEITRHIDCAFLLVPRSGAASRFAPIKTQEDRCLHTPALLRLLREQATADPRPCDNIAYAAADEAAGHA